MLLSLQLNAFAPPTQRYSPSNTMHLSHQLDAFGTSTVATALIKKERNLNN
jgi:hypothetical protein